MTEVLGVEFIPYESRNEHLESYKVWLESDYDFKISPSYWYEGEYLIRKSDHWKKYRDCYWILNTSNSKHEIGKVKFSELIQNI